MYMEQNMCIGVSDYDTIVYVDGSMYNKNIH